MTVAALRALLQEIDRQGGPEAARRGLLRIPDPPTEEGTTPVDHNPQPTTPRILPEDPERIAVGKLLKWGDDHTDPNVQDQAARARAVLTGLRRRYAADHELAAITNEEQQLQERLAQLQARRSELVPPPAKGRRAKSYNAGVVRGWARENNIPCPASGRVPKAVVTAWREATATPGPAAP